MFCRVPLLVPIRPPAVTQLPEVVIVLAADRFDRLPLLKPIRPPMFAKPPVLTVPVAVELVTALEWLLPMRPPSRTILVFDAPVPLTLPDALDDAIEPSFCATSPPDEPAPPFTVVEAVVVSMLPPFNPTSPPNAI